MAHLHIFVQNVSEVVVSAADPGRVVFILMYYLIFISLNFCQNSIHMFVFLCVHVLGMFVTPSEWNVYYLKCMKNNNS